MDIEAKSEPVAPPRKKLTKLKSECINEENVKKVVRPITIFTSKPDSLSKESSDVSKKVAPKRPPFPNKSISFDIPQSQIKNKIESVEEEKPFERPKPLPRPTSVNKPTPSPRKSLPNHLMNAPLDTQMTTKALDIRTNNSQLYMQQNDNSNISTECVKRSDDTTNANSSIMCLQQNTDSINVTGLTACFQQSENSVTTIDSQQCVQHSYSFINTNVLDTSNLQQSLQNGDASTDTNNSQQCLQLGDGSTDEINSQQCLVKNNDSIDINNSQQCLPQGDVFIGSTNSQQCIRQGDDFTNVNNLQEHSIQSNDFTDSSVENINTKKNILKKKYSFGLKSCAKITVTELHKIHAKLTSRTKNVFKSFKINTKCFSQYDLMVYAFYETESNTIKRSKSLEFLNNAVVHKPYYENCEFNEFFPKCKSYKQRHTIPYENIDINKTTGLDDQVFLDDQIPLSPIQSNLSEYNKDYSEIKISSIKSKQFRPAASIPYLGLRVNMKQGFHKDFEKVTPEKCEQNSLYDSPRAVASDYINLESTNFFQKCDLVNDSILFNPELPLLERQSETQKPLLQSKLENNNNQVLSTKEKVSSSYTYDSPILDGFQVYDSPKVNINNSEYESMANYKNSTENDNCYEKLDLKAKGYDFVPQRPPPPHRNSQLHSSFQESLPVNYSSDGTSSKKQEPPRPPPPNLLTNSKKEPSQVHSSDPNPGIDSSKSTSKLIKNEEFSSDSQSDNEAKYEKPPGRKLFLIAQEILTTERSFVNALKLICEDFKEKVRAALAKNNKFLPEGAFQSIFMNVEQIYELDKKFLKELEERMEKWEHHKRIGDIIRSYSYFLKMYVTYIKGYDNAMLVLHDCLSTNLKFAHFVAEFEEKNMKISSYLLRPIQRIPSYRLLLKEYLKNLPKDSVDFKDITDGVEIVSEIANHINESMKEGEKFQEVLRIQSMIVNHKDLIKPGRFLVKEGSLQKMSRKELQQRIFILFTDTLLYCSSVGQTQLKLIHELPLTEMVVQYPEFEDMTSEFSIVSKKRSFYLKASSTKERDEWVKTLQECIEIAKRKMGTFTKEPPVMVMDLGDVAPPWIPDSRVTMCQSCTQVFNIYKRRHHCRACGKVVCSDCSSFEAPLKFMDYEALRVCEECFVKLLTRFNEIHFENKNEEIHAKFKKKTKKQKVDRKKLLPSTLTEIDAHEEGIQISGFLKLVRKGQKDKRCWFVLKDHVLYKYKASSDPAAKTTTPILGYGVEVLGNWEEDFMFALTHAGLKEPLVYKAENKTSAERWLHCLTKATELAQL
ncbi:FYVE, RhoGEF and PH domain-containing protein 6 isoform X2 [Hydra vulgaris]|uniref:FYVE, RhoGEF and PH domain-containing protein 6 isoform X2 n=1 Tax=Hydra vulgaris TaxID=6087 RepID=A0ABM4DGY6_HYDVU